VPAPRDPSREPIHTVPSDSLPADGELGFRFEAPNGRLIDALCVRHDGVPRAYINSCPHWGITLDMEDGRFWSHDRGHLECINHGAMFRPTDGFCETGPCLGASLTPLTVEESKGELRFFASAWRDEDLAPFRKGDE
jgi:nitrite reductase/ring-hydroxylating ferredoxin subunit